MAPHAQLCQLQPIPVCIQKRTFHGDCTTEVLDGALTAADDKQVTVMIGLDQSAAFDNVDHRFLLDRLRTEFGVAKTPFNWLQSDLEGRTQFVKMGQHRSHAAGVDYVLGSMLFAVYCSPIADVIAYHSVQYHQYADDTQLHLIMRADNKPTGLSVLTQCTTDVRQWYLQCRTTYNSTRVPTKVL